MQLRLIPDNIPTNWEELVSWGVRNIKGSSRVSPCKLAWWSAVYHVWFQRNSKIHIIDIKTEEQLVTCIQRNVKARIEAKSTLNKVLYASTGLDTVFSCNEEPSFTGSLHRLCLYYYFLW